MGKEKIIKKSIVGGKKVSIYNTFIKNELLRVKKNNPTIAHKDTFKMAANNWAKSPDNPKNKK